MVREKIFSLFLIGISAFAPFCVSATVSSPAADEPFLHPGNIQYYPEMTGRVIQNMEQDDLGHYWISTRDEGVWHYDGLEFISVGLEQEDVRNLMAMPGGGCAAATQRGLFYYKKDQQWEFAFPCRADLPLLCNDIAEGQDESLWIGSDWGLFHRISDNAVKLYTSSQIAAAMADWIPSISCHAVPDAVLKEVNLFAGIGAVIQAYVDKSVRKLVVLTVASDSPADEAGLACGDIILEVNGRKNPLQRDIRGVKGSSLNLLVKKQDQQEPVLLSITHQPYPDRMNAFRIRSICQTAEGNIMGSTAEGALVKLAPESGQWDVVIPAKEGERIKQLHAHPDTGYYLSSSKGLWHEPFLESEAPEGLLTNSKAIAFMALHPDGSLWISDEGRKVKRYRNGRWETIDVFSGMPIRCIGKDGSLWFGRNELVCYSPNQSRFHYYPGLQFEIQKRDGEAWFLNMQGKPLRYQAGEWDPSVGSQMPFESFLQLFTIGDNRLMALGVDTGRLGLAEWIDGKWSTLSVSDISSRLSESVPFIISYDDEHLWIVRKKNGKSGQRPWYILSVKEVTDGEWTWNQHEYYPNIPPQLRALGKRSSGRPVIFAQNQWVLTDDGRFRIRSYPRELTDYSRFPSAFTGEGVVFAASDSEWMLYDGKQISGRFSAPEQEYRNIDPVDLLVDHSQKDFHCWTTWGGSLLSRYIDGAWLHSTLNIAGSEDTAVTVSGQDADGSLWLNTAEGVIHYHFRNDAPKVVLDLSYARAHDGCVVMAQAQGRDPWNLTPANELLYSFRLNGGAWTEPSTEKTHRFEGLEFAGYTVDVRVFDGDFNVSAIPTTASVVIPLPLWRQPLLWIGIVLMIGLSLLLAAAYIHIRMARLKAIGVREAHLRELEQMRLRLVTGITHELRTPLTLILGPIERLREEIQDNSHIERIERNAKRLLHTINELLDLRKLEVGAHRLNLSHGDLVAFARELVDSFQSAAENAAVRLDFRSDVDHLPWEFDASKLDKVLVNLMANALKATPESGEIHLLIESDVSAEPNEKVRLILEDTGCGISESQRLHIFERYYRVEDQTPQESCKPGTGIGLALVKEFVELHGGRIWAECPERSLPSDPATRFVIELPRPPAVADTASSEKTSVNSSENKPLLLVVDDDDEIREFLQSELEEEFRILTASNGNQALEIAGRNEIDLILSDVMMAEMDGMEMTRCLKSDPNTSHIPVMLLTARSGKEHEFEGLEAGADDYVPKPFTVSILRARIHNRLETRRKLRERFSAQVKVEPSRIAVTTEDEKLLAKAIALVDRHLENSDFDSAAFAGGMAMSERNLQRKLKAITGETPRKFIRTMRMKRAAQLIQDGMSIGDAAAQVGYFDSGRFAQYFRQTIGMTPTQYKTDITQPSAE